MIDELVQNIKVQVGTPMSTIEGAFTAIRGSVVSCETVVTIVTTGNNNGLKLELQLILGILGYNLVITRYEKSM